jgi:hypothetical protein
VANLPGERIVISFLAFHAIATRRGEGLHPSLVRFFERWPSTVVDKSALDGELSCAASTKRHNQEIYPTPMIVDRNKTAADILIQPIHARTIGVDDLDVEMVVPALLFPYRQTCGVRLGRNGAVTIVLGTRDPGHDASSYLAGILVERLGIPWSRARLFYTGMHPAVRRTPQQPVRRLRSVNVGSTVAAIGAVIESLCDQVIEKDRRPSTPQDKGRSSFAS